MSLLRFNLYPHCCNFVRSDLLKIALNFDSTLPSLPQHCCCCSNGAAVTSTLMQTGGTDVWTRCAYGKEDPTARFLCKNKNMGHTRAYSTSFMDPAQNVCRSVNFL